MLVFIYLSTIIPVYLKKAEIFNSSLLILSKNTEYSSSQDPDFTMCNPYIYNSSFRQTKNSNDYIKFGRASQGPNIIIPSIQPILQIISTNLDSIYTQVNRLLSNLIIDVKSAINAYIAAEIPKIKNVIVTNNTTITAGLTSIFKNTIANITTDINAITRQEKADTATMINNNNTGLLNSITTRMIAANTVIGKLISSEIKTPIADISAALMAANNDIYIQITAILENSINKEAILPQLVYAIPTNISSIFNSTGKKIYAAIVAELTNSISDIKGYIRATKTSSLTIETTILKNSNSEILAAINKQITAMLGLIQPLLRSVTTSEIGNIKSIITADSNALLTRISGLILTLNRNVRTIITSITTNEINSVIARIRSNNQSAIKQMSLILN